jgi:MtrB/PioB family decaheme-associated outer membrane protein
MMRERSRRLCVGLALLGALASRRDAVHAEEPADPVVTQGWFTLGGGSVSGLNESSKFQEYREIPNGFFLPSLEFGLAHKGWTFDIQAIDLREDDQRVVITMGKPGTYRLVLGYDQTPKWFSNTAATLFAHSTGGRYLFPATIRQQLQSAAPPSQIGPLLQSSLAAAQPFPDLRYRRDKAFGTLDWTAPVKGLSLRAAFDQEQRHGTHPQTLATNFSVGPDVTEFAGRTEFTTRTARLGLDYARSIFWVGAEVAWSQFRNGLSSPAGSGVTLQDAYVVDNPLRATDGTPTVADPAAPNNRAASRFLLSAPPDTQSTWINLNAGVKVASWGRLSVLYSFGRNEQDEIFLPFTLNSAIVPLTPLVVLEGGASGTPATRYDGSIDLTRWDARFDGHPVRWLSFQVFGHSYEYDNKTPDYVMPDYVSTDVALAGVAAEAEPRAYTTTRYGASVTFRPAAGLALGVSGERESWERRLRPVPNTDEDIFGVHIDWEPAPWGRIRLAYREGDRTDDTYEKEDPTVEPGGFREFDLANRKQKRYDLLANFTPLDRFSIGVQLNAIDDDYPDTSLGRTRDKSTGWAVDFSVDAGRSVVVSGNYGKDHFEWDLLSRYRVPSTPPLPPVEDPANDWSTFPDDTVTSYGVGVNAPLIVDRLFLDARVAVADSRGRQPAVFAAGGAAQSDGTAFPDVTDKLETLDAALRWAVRKNLSVSLALTHESWDATNFQRDVVQPWMGALDPSTSESVYLGMRIPNYDVNWIRVLLSYTF